MDFKDVESVIIAASNGGSAIAAKAQSLNRARVSVRHAAEDDALVGRVRLRVRESSKGDLAITLAESDVNFGGAGQDCVVSLSTKHFQTTTTRPRVRPDQKLWMQLSNMNIQKKGTLSLSRFHSASHRSPERDYGLLGPIAIAHAAANLFNIDTCQQEALYIPFLHQLVTFHSILSLSEP